MHKDPVLKDLIEDFKNMKNESTVLCFSDMEPRFIDYRHKEFFTAAFPVLDRYLNPRKTMQGGFITAAFDNAFGALAYYSYNHRLMATIDISTSFHYPIYSDDELIITTRMISMGNTIASMRGEAVDRNGRIIATASTNMLILK
jgi:uncharacterized protein (TIGR00369 family)